MAGQCPKCGALCASVRCEHVDVRAGTTTWHGVSYSCPFCFAILSTGIDPVALKADIVADVVREMKKLLR